MSIDSNTKIETTVAIVGGILAAAGAVMIAPVPMIIGAATVTAATAFRLAHSYKLREAGGPKPLERIPDPRTK